MGKARVSLKSNPESGKIDRYLAKDLGTIAKKRLKMLKICSFFLAASIILNIYQILH